MSPNKYCKEKLLTNHCTVCKSVVITKTRLEPRLVKKVVKQILDICKLY